MINAEGVPGTSDDNSLILNNAKPISQPSTPRNSTRPCLVCNDNYPKTRRSYYYGAFTCTSCMGFFRRCEHLYDHKLNYICKKNETCDLSQYISNRNRKWCQYCRYKKCLAVGMVPYYKSVKKEMSSLRQRVDLEESAATDPVKSEHLTGVDACTEVTPNKNILDNEEAEDVTLPTDDSLVTHLEYEVEWASDAVDKSVKKEMSSLRQRVDLEESAATDPVKSEHLTGVDACTEVTPNKNILDNEEAEDVTLPTDDSLVTHLEYEVEWASDAVVKSVKMEMPSLRHGADLAESAAMDPVLTEPLTSPDACTGVIPHENILDIEEAEDVTLPTEDPLVPHLQYEVEWASDDFTAVKNEISYINMNCSDTATEIALNNNTIPLQEEESDAEDIPLSRFKFEPAILGEINKNISEPSILSVKSDLPRSYDIADNDPVVYTTRLDDMRVFNNIHCNFDKTNLFENIIIESKPKMKACNDNSPRTHYKSEISFRNLVEKLNTINMKLRQGDHHDPIKSLNLIDYNVKLSERSKKLLKMCKPFSIPLEDLKNKHLKRASKVKDSFLHKSDTGKPKSEHITMKSSKIVNSISSWRKITSQETKIIFIILNNIETNIKEIYLVDGYGIVRQYYRNTVNKADTYYHNLQKQLYYKQSTDFCCWYERQGVIKSFCSSIDINLPPFMTARHDCNGTNCRCCCNPFVSIPRHNYESAFIIDDASELWPKNIVQSLYRVHNNDESLLINNAIRYIPRMPGQTKKYTKAKQAEIAVLQLRNAKIRLKNKRNNENEYYELGANGEIVKYIKNQKQDKNTYISQTDIKTFTYCCWFERENILRKLLLMKVSPNTLIFMKKSHSCPLLNCRCCCKLNSYRDLKRRPVLKINLPMSPLHTSNNNKTTLVKIQFHEKTPISNIITKSVTTELYRDSSVPVSQKNDVDFTDPKTNVHTSNSKKSVQKLNINSTTSIITKTNVSSLNKTDLLSTFKLPCHKLKRLTNSIIEKFSNVALDINNEGKLTATINNSEAELSKTDLKILGNMLSIAQKEMDELKFAARTNINKPDIAPPNTTTVPARINNVRSLLNNFNDNITKESSKLTPNDVANKKQKSSKYTDRHRSFLLTLKDNIYADFASLYYANRIHSLSAFSQIKNNTIMASRKPLPNEPSNITSFTHSNNSTNDTNELGSVNMLINRLRNEIVGEINPQIADKTQLSNTTKFRVQRPLEKPGPVHGVFSKFPATTTIEKKGEERVDVFTHKTIKRNQNMADQNGNKRIRVETTQLNEPFSSPYCNNGSNIINPNNYPFLPSTAQVSNQSSNMATQVPEFNPNVASISGNTPGVSNNIIFSPFAQVVDNMDLIGVFPAAASPVQIPHANLVSKNIMFGTDATPILQPLTLASPQAPLVKVEPPALAGHSLPVFPFSSGTDEKQSDDCILGM